MYPGSGKDEYQTTINLGIIRGGDTVNIVPDEARMQLDICHIYTDSKEQIIQNIQKIDSHMLIKILIVCIKYNLLKVPYNTATSSGDGIYVKIIPLQVVMI